MIEPIAINDFAQSCGGRLVPSAAGKAVKIKGLAIDSREVRAGYLYAALPG